MDIHARGVPGTYVMRLSLSLLAGVLTPARTRGRTRCAGEVEEAVLLLRPLELWQGEQVRRGDAALLARPSLEDGKSSLSSCKLTQSTGTE